MNIVEAQGQELAARLSVNELAIDDLDSKIKDLQAKKKNLVDSVESFKDELREAMETSGISRIENKEYGILFRLDPPSKRVEILDESLIPEEYFRIKREVNKAAIKSALGMFHNIEGAAIVEGKSRLVIKK